MNDIAYYNLHVAKLLKISHLHVGKLQANRLANPDVFSRIFQQTALLVYFVNLHDMTTPTSAKQELAVGGVTEITRMNTGQLIIQPLSIARFPDRIEKIAIPSPFRRLEAYRIRPSGVMCISALPETCNVSASTNRTGVRLPLS